MIQLELPDEQNSEPLIEYWTSGVINRRKDVEPILQSACDTQGLNQLDLSHLLPPIPRKLLYTYAGSNYMFNGTLPDCHWTTLNFINHEPHEYLLDTRFVHTFVDERCVAAQPPYKFGDWLFMVHQKPKAFSIRAFT